MGTKKPLQYVPTTEDERDTVCPLTCGDCDPFPRICNYYRWGGRHQELKLNLPHRLMFHDGKY